MKVIIGIDPGTNVGLAIFDLNGNLILVKTLKRAGKNEITREIEKVGKPIIVATDVKETPSIVKKVASYFNSKIFSPDRELTSLEKAKTFDDFLEKYPEKINVKKINLHERDAIISAIRFFRKMENKIRWIEKIIEKKNLKKHAEEIKCKVFEGEKIANIIKALEKNLS
jgi:predicted RNase H-like nuclease (RuvC/YqgF family)